MAKAALVSSVKCFEGLQKIYRHASEKLKCEMNFSLYVPPQVAGKKCPILYWLSGMACTERTFIEKSGFQHYAAKHGIIVVGPDTSPRCCNIEGEEDSQDFGSGASFYFDATEDKWKNNYRMYSYDTKETRFSERLPIVFVHIDTMALEYLQRVKYVAHVHTFRYEDGKVRPIEIGMVQILPNGVPEIRRHSVLWTVDNSHLSTTGKDRLFNRKASLVSNSLPTNYVVEWTLEEAQHRAVKQVKKNLLAVKGEEAFKFFRDFGLDVVDIKTQIAGHCPNFKNLPLPPESHFTFEDHCDHANPIQCSRIAALKYALFLEKKKRGVFKMPTSGK